MKCLALIMALLGFTWRPRICDHILLGLCLSQTWERCRSAPALEHRKAVGLPGMLEGPESQHRHAMGAVAKVQSSCPALACGVTGCLSGHPEAHCFYPQKH